MSIRKVLATVLVAVLLAAGASIAQELSTVGTVVGTVDGEPFELVASEGVVEPGAGQPGVTISTTYWNSWFDGVLDVTLLAQSRPSLFSVTPGAMLIDFTLTTAGASCPCAGDQASIFYSPDGGFTANVYDDLEAEVTVASVEAVEPGVYRLVGTFRGLLGLKETMTDRPDPERTVVVEGTFTIERLAEEQDVP